MLSRLLLLEVAVGLFVCTARLAAENVQLAWDASSSSGVTAYIVRYGTAGSANSYSTNVGNQTAAGLAGLQAGQTYYFAVYARDAAGVESPPSNQATYTVPTSSLPNITLTSPSGGTAYQSPATISFTANVTANGYTITKVQFFNGSALLGEDLSSPYGYTWANMSAGTYSLSAKAVYSSGGTVSSPVANITVANPTTNPPSVNGLTFEAISGQIALPFKVANGTVSQTVDTGLSGAGRAAYTFNVASAGNYTVEVDVDAPNGSQNSLFVNIDGEPTDPYMVWHIPVTTGLQRRPVSWQGNGTVDSSQFAPKVFALSAGTHQLIIRGREANVKLGTIAVLPASSLPAPWQTTDIGAVAQVGSAGQSSGTYTVRGAGQLSGTRDSFRFVYQPLNFDGEIRARLTAVETNNLDGDFGVMIRESLSPNSKYAFMGVAQDLKFVSQRRSSSAGSTYSTVSTASTLPNTWVRLVRSGSTLTGYRSADGANWTSVNSTSITMATNIYVGFAVASGNTNLLSSATFDNAFVRP